MVEAGFLNGDRVRMSNDVDGSHAEHMTFGTCSCLAPVSKATQVHCRVRAAGRSWRDSRKSQKPLGKQAKTEGAT